MSELIYMDGATYPYLYLHRGWRSIMLDDLRVYEEAGPEQRAAMREEARWRCMFLFHPN